MSTPVPLNDRLAYLDRLSEASLGGRAMSLEEGLELAQAHGLTVSADAVEEALGAPQISLSPAHACSENKEPMPEFAWTPDWNRPGSLEELAHERQAGEEALKKLQRLETGIQRAIMGAGVLLAGSLLSAVVMAVFRNSLGIYVALSTDLVAGVLAGVFSKKVGRVEKKLTQARERLDKLAPVRPYRTELNQWKSEPRLVHHLQQCLTSAIGLRMGDVQDLRKAWTKIVREDDNRATPEDLAALLTPSAALTETAA